MNRQTSKRTPARRPTNLTLRLQQAWRRDGQHSRQETAKNPPAPPRAA